MAQRLHPSKLKMRDNVWDEIPDGLKEINTAIRVVARILLSGQGIRNSKPEMSN